MRKAKLLSTVAFALLFGAGAASAQGMSKDTPERAPAAQQSAPAEKVAPSMKNGEQKAPQTTARLRQTPRPARPRDMDRQPTNLTRPRRRPVRRRNLRSPTWVNVALAARRRNRALQTAASITSRIPTTAGGFALDQVEQRTEPHDHRPRCGWFGKAHDRTTHQDQHGHQVAEGGARKSERVGQRRYPHPDKRARPYAAAGSDRDLSRVAWLRLHSGGRPDRDY